MSGDDIGKRDELGRPMQDVRQDFGDKTVEFVRDEDGAIFVEADSLGHALGYKNPAKAISNLYAENADELTRHRSFLVRRNGQTTHRVTVYTEQGAYTIGMLARTKWAKSFRLWLAKTCEKLRAGEQRIYSPAYVETLEQENAVLREHLEISARIHADQASMLAKGLASYGWSKRKHPELHGRKTRQIAMFRPPQVDAQADDEPPELGIDAHTA